MMHMLYVEDRTRQGAVDVLGISATRVTKLHDDVVAKLWRRLRDW